MHLNIHIKLFLKGKNGSLHTVKLKSIPRLLLQSNWQGLFSKFHAKLLKYAPYTFPHIIQHKHFSSDRHFERSKCRTKAKSDMKRKFWNIEMNGWISQKIHDDTLDLQKWFCLCDYSFNA